MIDPLLHDLRFALRTLHQRPGFAPTLALAALVATLLPALRAPRVDPIESMRSE